MECEHGFVSIYTLGKVTGKLVTFLFLIIFGTKIFLGPKRHKEPHEEVSQLANSLCKLGFVAGRAKEERMRGDNYLWFVIMMPQHFNRKLLFNTVLHHLILS